MTRRDELAAGLADVRERIASACAAAGRDPGEVTLIAVTKTHPASDVADLAAFGIQHVGENRHPEAQHKHSAVEEGESPAGLTWHFLGAVQTNKANQIARYADVVHSIDRPKLVTALARGAEVAGRVLDCLVQVDFDTTDPGRAGVAPDGVADLADLVAQHDTLRLCGVMTVAPLGADPAATFAHLQTISLALRERHPEATVISAGMTEDLDAAIAHGATHVRLGRALLGARPSLK